MENLSKSLADFAQFSSAFAEFLFFKGRLGTRLASLNFQTFLKLVLEFGYDEQKPSRFALFCLINGIRYLLFFPYKTYFLHPSSCSQKSLPCEATRTFSF